MVSDGSKSEKENMCEPNSRVSVLVLHNDNFNTFEFVISALCDHCDHTREQAEQCALITHLKGRCEIKKGNRGDLVMIHSQLKQLSLTVTLE
jgi:ATP-dependent Clp protease adaptor protein ClpS